jgi:RNA polymerase sigma-70 factor, ECF subfamily
MSDRHQLGLTEADMVAARRREPVAVTRIYTAYAPALFRFFLAAVSDRRQAKDLTSTTFVSAIEDLPRFRGPVDALGGWLFQIARHDLYDFRRRQGRSWTEPLEENLSEATAATGGDDPEEVAIERLERGRVLVALQQLSPDQREVLLLRMAGGLTAPEVAAALHTTPRAVEALQKRGLAKLGRILGLRPPLPVRTTRTTSDGLDATQAAATSTTQQEPPPEHGQDPDGPIPPVGRRWGTFLRLPGAAAFGGLSLLLLIFSGWSLTVAEWLVRRAAPQMLPKAHRDRYSEEWSAELASFDGGRYAKLGMAVSILVYASSTKRALRQMPIDPKAEGQVIAAKTKRRRRLEALLVGMLTAGAVFAGLACSLYLPSGPPPSRVQLSLACLAALLSGVLAAWEVWPRKEHRNATETHSE